MRVIGTAQDIRRRARRRLARGGALLSLGILLLLTWLVLHYLDIGSLSVYFLVGFSGVLASAWGDRRAAARAQDDGHAGGGAGRDS